MKQNPLSCTNVLVKNQLSKFTLHKIQTHTLTSYVIHLVQTMKIHILFRHILSVWYSRIIWFRVRNTCTRTHAHTHTQVSTHTYLGVWVFWEQKFLGKCRCCSGPLLVMPSVPHRYYRSTVWHTRTQPHITHMYAPTNAQASNYIFQPTSRRKLNQYLVRSTKYLQKQKRKYIYIQKGNVATRSKNILYVRVCSHFVVLFSSHTSPL